MTNERPPPFVEVFHKILLFLKDGFPYRGFRCCRICDEQTDQPANQPNTGRELLHLRVLLGAPLVFSQCYQPRNSINPRISCFCSSPLPKCFAKLVDKINRTRGDHVQRLQLQHQAFKDRECDNYI